MLGLHQGRWPADPCLLWRGQVAKRRCQIHPGQAGGMRLP
ncbi:hypothetical protein LINGRAPRIM_LOCUS1427 [Linum grandiflorum]